MQVGVCHVLHLQHASASRHCAMKQTATGEQMASVYSKLIQATFSSLHLKYMTHRETKTIFLLLLDFLIFSSTYRVSEKAKAPHSSTLAWKIPWMEEPGRLQSMGSAKSQTRLGDFTFTFHFHALEKKMATHSSVLAWRIPGTVGPGGLPSMGSHRVRHD